MSTRHRRISFTAIWACAALVATVALPAASLFTAASTTPAAAAVPQLTNVLHLSVQPSMPSKVAQCGTPAGTALVAAGGTCWPDAVGKELHHYKWLIQQDNSGDPSQPSGPVASNDGTLTCGGGTCYLHSPTAPFLYNAANATTGAAGAASCTTGNFPDLVSGNPGYADGTSLDIGTKVTWTPTGQSTPVNGTITTVCNAKDVIVSANASTQPAGTLLFSVQRPDPCHPITPLTPSGNPNFPAAYNPATDPNAKNYPGVPQMPACNWPSIHTQSHPPVVTQGDETDWSVSQALSGVLQAATGNCAVKTRAVLNKDCGLTLPNGKYFVSVTSDTYELSGTSFTVPMVADPNQGYATVNVRLNPGPLALATMRLLAYDDMVPTGGAWEETTEGGMSGFMATLTDFGGAGPVSQDYFGNPLCTTYQTDPNTGQTLVKPDGTPQKILHLGGKCISQPNVLGLIENSPLAAGDTTLKIRLLPGVPTDKLPPAPFTIQIDQEQITVNTVSAVTQSNGASFITFGNLARGANGTTAAPHAQGTNVPDPSSEPTADGIITIPNLPPGHYGATVHPPDPAWLRTTTLEGGAEWDVWIMGNDNGLDRELTVAGEPVPWATFGFARAAMANIDPNGGKVDPTNLKIVPANPPQANDPTKLTYSVTDPQYSNGAFATAGCEKYNTFTTAAESIPTGDIRAAWEKAMVPCDGVGITKRQDIGFPGQTPTPDGSLQADTWIYPYTSPLYGLKQQPAGELKGRVAQREPYVPGVGAGYGTAGANGQAGEQISNFPIQDAWVALADLNNGDQTTMVFPAKSDGFFDIKGIPDGTYNMAWWDWHQDYAFDQWQVSIENGQVVDLGLVPLTGWFTKISGFVFVDANGNGKRDPGEAAVPDFLMQLLNRTNNAYDGGQNVATTNDAGYYEFKEAYPLGNDMVLQFYNQRYKTTGVSCKSDNDPQWHTTITAAVDLTSLNIIGLNGECDIGVQPYSTDPTANDNGGIVATAMYHPLRAEVSEEQSVTWPWDTGQPGVRFELWKPVPDPTGKSKYLTCTPANHDAGLVTDAECSYDNYDGTVSPAAYDGSVARAAVPLTRTDSVSKPHVGDPKGTVYDASIQAPDSGLLVFGQGIPAGAAVGTVNPGVSFQLVGSDGLPLDTSAIGGSIMLASPSQMDVYYSEHYQRGGANQYSQPGCVPRGADGQVLDWQTQAAVLPGGDCVEAALQGTSFSFGSDGNPIDPRLYDMIDPVTGKKVDRTDVRSLDPGYNPGNFNNGADPYPGLNTLCAVPGASANLGQCGIHGVQVVDGNYGLTPPRPGDYIVHAVFPSDMFGKPLYKWATEATSNIYSGPGWTVQDPADSTPLQWQAAPPPNVSNVPNKGMSLTPSTGQPFAFAKCTGALFTVNNTNANGADYVDNPSLVTAYNGSPPFEGKQRPLCDSKLIHVQNGQSYAPNFLMYTDVPLASKFSGYATDDISVSTNKLSTGLGEVQPITNLPIGIYDWTNRQISEVNTDYNGQWEVILPSTNTFNANTVSGIEASVYQFVGNDPGQPSSPNLNWNPAYHTISAFFQAFPDVYEPSDVAPQRVVASFEGNGSQISAAVVCAPRASQPQVFAVSHPFLKPYVADARTKRLRDGRPDTYTLVIKGIGFGDTKPDSNGFTLRRLDATNTDLSGIVGTVANSDLKWSDTEIDVTLATGTASSTSLHLRRPGGDGGVPAGPYELVITNAAGLSSLTGLTFHVLGARYNPAIYEVGTFAAGVLDSNGNPAGPAITDNGYIDPKVPRNAGPVQYLVDSDTGGFNPNNQNFLPAAPNAPANAANTTGGTWPAPSGPGTPAVGGPKPGATSPNGAVIPNGYAGDSTVKGAVQRALEAASHRWDPNIGALSGGIGAAGTVLTVALQPGQSTATLPAVPFTITIGNEQIQVGPGVGSVTAGANNVVTFHNLHRGVNGTTAAGHGNGAGVTAKMGLTQVGVLPSLAATTIDQVAVSNNVATLRTTTPHGLAVGEQVTVSGLSHAAMNGTWVVTAVANATHFSFAVTTPNLAPVADAGTVTPVQAAGTLNVQLTGGTTLLDLRVPFDITIGTEQIRVPYVSSTASPNTPNAFVTFGSAAKPVVRGAHHTTVVNHLPGSRVQIATATQDQNLVVVYPNWQYDSVNKVWGGQAWAPLSTYFENVIVHSPVMLQGSGPGGFYKDNNGATVAVPGSTLDGRFINANTGTASTTTDSFAGNEPWAFDWTQLIGGDGNADGLQVTQPYSNSADEVEGMVVYVVSSPGRFRRDANGFQPSVDGLGITGGDQKGFPQSISEAGGEPAPAGFTVGGPEGGGTFAQEIQGGAVMLEAEVTHFQLSNNLIQWNSGTYGTVRSGAPHFGLTGDIPGGDPVSNNDFFHIHHNRIEEDGGTNLAGAIGLFRGTDAYRINDNSICGNLATEYGGGISHFGYSPWSEIDHNQVHLNQSIDEGAGIMIAGEPPINLATTTPDPNQLSMGAGPVAIHDNYMSANSAYDDGGALRFLEAGAYRFDVYNNIINNNVSSHEGGGVAIDNAPNVHLVNNTITNNVTTATATTSTGDPAPAGVSTTTNSGQLMNFLNGKQTIELDTPNGTLPAAKCTDISDACSQLSTSSISNPVMLNDVIWDNLAGSWDWNNSTVLGICLPANGRAGDGTPNNISPCQFTHPTPGGGFDAAGEPTGTGYLVGNQAQLGNQVDGSGPNIWDVGAADTADGVALLKPSHSLVSSGFGWNSGAPGLHNVVATNAATTNPNADPKFVQQFLTSVQADQYRLQYRFRPGTLVTLNLPTGGLGDYHLGSQSSSAVRLGANLAPVGTVQSGETVTAPSRDIDFDPRPLACPDSGADQLRAGGECGDGGGGGGGGGFGGGGGGFGGGGAGVIGGAAAGVAGGNAVAAGIGPAPRQGHSNGATLVVAKNPGRAEPVLHAPAVGAHGTPAGTTPPAGGLTPVGGADSAGNTAVAALPGSASPSKYATSSNVPNAPAAATSPSAVGATAPVQPALMPGGTSGGGHFTLPHRGHRVVHHGGGLAWWAWVLISCVVGGAVLAIVGLRRRRKPRHFRGRRPTAPRGLPPDDDPAFARPLETAGKGDRS